MKNKSAFTKILLLALCLAFSLTALTACGNDEAIETLQQDVTANTDKITENTEKIDGVANNTESKANIAALRQLVESIKVTADDAATAAQLEEATNKLASVETTANAAATAQALADVDAALKALVATADAELADDIDDVIDMVEALAAEAATKAELDADVAVLEAAIATKANTADVDAEIEELLALIGEKADTATVNAAIAAINARLDGGIRDTLNNLDAAINSNKAADEETKAALKADIDAINAQINGSIKDTLDALEAAVAANAATDAATKEFLYNHIDALYNAVAGKVDAVKYNEAMDAIRATIATLATKEELNTVKHYCADLTSAVEARINAKIVAINTEYARLAAQLNDVDAALKAEIAALGAKIDALVADKDAFVKDFQAATALLKSDDATYSLEAYRALVAAYAAEQMMYEAPAFAAFAKEADRIDFYLTRATSVEEIHTLINVEFKAAADELAKFDWRINFPTNLANMKGTMTPATDITTIVAVHDSLVAIGGVITPEVEEEYQAMLQAKAMLDTIGAEAAAVEALIDAIGDVVYLVSDGDIIVARAEFDAFAAKNFPAVVVLAASNPRDYFDPSMTAAGLVANYAVLEEAEARVLVLADAFANVPAVAELAKNFATARPLFTDLDALNANAEEFNTWIATYKLEAVNVDALLTAKGTIAEYALLVSAQAYADTMNTIYNDIVVAGDLNAKIAAFPAVEALLLSADEANVVAVRDAIDALVKAMNDVADYDDAIDANFEAMITDYATFEAANVRILELNALKALIDGEVAKVAAIDAQKLTFADSAAIKAFRAALDAAYKAYGIVEGDAIYVELATAAEARYEELRAAYNVLTADIKKTYDEAMEWLKVFNGGEGVLPIADGENIINVFEGLKKIVLEDGLTEVDLELEEGKLTNTNLKDLYLEFNKVAIAFDKQAKAAEVAAAELLKDIKALKTATKNLHNLASYVEVYNDLCTWINTYIDPEFDGSVTVAGDEYQTFVDAFTAVKENLNDVIDSIQNIEIYDEDPATTEYYTFLTTANIKSLTNKIDASVKNMYAAYGISKDLKAALTDASVTITGWDIHSNFATPLADYNKFVKDYCANNLNAELDVYFDLLGDYEAFMDAKAQYDVAFAKVDGLATLIKTLIADLGDPKAVIAMADAADILVKVDEINALIADFYAATNCKVVDCADCLAMLGADNVLALYRIEMRAEFTAAYYAVYQTADADTKTKIEGAKIFSDNLMTSATDAVQIDRAYAAALAYLDLYIPAP